MKKISKLVWCKIVWVIWKIPKLPIVTNWKIKLNRLWNVCKMLKEYGKELAMSEEVKCIEEKVKLINFFYLNQKYYKRINV